MQAQHEGLPPVVAPQSTCVGLPLKAAARDRSGLVIASTPVGEIDHALDNSGNVAADPGLGSAGKSRRNHSVGGGLKVQGLAGDATGEIQPPEALRHLARHLPLKF